MSAQNGEGKEFSFGAIQGFDEHIAREIAGYDMLDRIVSDLSDAFVEDGTNVYDIGCSTGRFMNALATRVSKDPDTPRNVQLTGFEPNGNLTADFIPHNDNVRIVSEKVDATTKFENASLITSVFTLQFVPTQMRPAILRNIHDGLNQNGAFIWAEKVLASDPRLESIINGIHIGLKRQGSSAEDILAKDFRLRSMMRPLRHAQNIQMLEEAGFTTHEEFWRVNNFVGMVAVKHG